MIDAVLQAVRSAKLTPQMLDLDAFAMLRSLAPEGLFDEGEGELLLDIGAAVTSIVVHTNGIPRFVRILLMGGADITEGLVTTLGMSHDEAEAAKAETTIRSLAEITGLDETTRAVSERADRFVTEVVTPVLQGPQGLAQLWALCDRWIGYARECVFPGGCFFLNVAAEFDARPGPVRDAIAEARRNWLAVYESAISHAQERHELDPAVDPAALAFELDALGMAANLHAMLCDDRAIFDQARASMLDRLRSVATDSSVLPDS
jgi:hypothetical protein